MFARRGVRIRVRGAAALVPFAFAFAGPAPSAAAGPVWQKIGPFVQGNVNAVAVDPRTPQIVYVGSDSGLFKSTTSGISWNFSGVGIAADSVTAITIDPKRTTTLFAGAPNGIYRSKDSGATWQSVYSRADSSIRTIAVHPSQPIVFAAVLDAGTPSFGLLIESTDGGSSWHNGVIVPTVSAPSRVWLDPFNPSRLFVATEDGLYRSDDLGNHWALKLAQIVESLSFDPDAAGVVYVGTDAGDATAVQRSASSGDAWVPFANGLPQGAPAIVGAIAQVPGPPATLYASTAAGLFKTTTGNGGWGPAATGVQGQVGTLVPFGAPENSVYAGSTAGLFKLQTIAAGAVRLDSPFAALPPTSFVSIPGKGGALYAGVANLPGFSGVYRSSGGSTWTLANGNLPDTNVSAVAMSPQIPAGCADPCLEEPPLYAATNLGVFKTSDRGAHWAGVNHGLSSRSVTGLVADPLDPATLYALVNNLGVAKTSNAASSWASVNEGLGSLTVVALAIDPTSSATLYCSAGGDVYKSTDGAVHWTPLHAGFAATALAVAPTAPAVVYASSAGVVYRSPDGGTTWHALPVEGAANLISIAVDPHSASIVHAGGNSEGAFQSASAGADWSAFDAGLPLDPATGAFPPVFELEWDRTAGATLTAATPSGLFSIEPGPHASVCTSAVDTLCLNGGRFQVRVAWHANNLGTSGVGQAVPLTSDTGYFWFFQPTNVELMIKVLDGRTLNGHFWVFYGALSDVEYAITVTDTVTGEERIYQNAQGNLASVADTAAFPLGAAASTGSSALEEALARETASFEALTGMFAPDAARSSAAAAPCAMTTTALCLTANRFRVEVEWHARHLGTSGVGQAVPLTTDTGYFWFFQSSNVELVIKVLDARSFSGHFWVFYGALSNVEYTIRVTDTLTGNVKVYFNPQDHLASVADTAAF